MKEIKLYDYQEDMKERIEKSLCLHRSVMAQMPTGTGKTYLLTVVIDSFVKDNPHEKVWIVAHRRELVAQIEETVQRFHSFSPSQNESLLTSVKAMSIQWLMRHYDEIKEKPGMIVIDEAHHALAKTYKEMWKRYPKAKFLGLTATPCRLNGKGFTDLFEVLVQSWNIPAFISKGRLATYDFVSIKSDCVTQRLIDSLKKRGADGDYQNKEMDMLLNKRPSISRLYESFEEYGKDRKGIVYAINISHAQKIMELYQEHGVKAVAIDSKTPAAERQADIESFKKGDIQVLVNVDIFSEGFDCPDVEFVQLARPTLSLAKYLQMVGRGLRVAKGKKDCVIIDNVGLYRVFGLPSQIWNWKAMFEGRMSKREVQETMAMNIANTAPVISERDGKAQHDVDSEMMMVISHDQLTRTFELQEEDEEIVRKREQLLSGSMGRVKLLGNLLVKLTEPNTGRTNYIDMKNMHYLNWIYTGKAIPKVVYVGGVEFVKYQNNLHSRTKTPLEIEDAKGAIEDMGFYSRYICGYSGHMCRVLENDQSHYGGRCVIFLHNDPTEYFWLSGELHDGSLVVMGDDYRYYWVEKEKQKEYIGCATNYEEERKMNKRLSEIISLTNLRANKECQKPNERLQSLEPCQVGKKWGLRGTDNRIIVPPIYRNIRSENGFFAFEQLVNHWGIMDGQGKVVIQPKYDKVEVTAEGIAILTLITGKIKKINLK